MSFQGFPGKGRDAKERTISIKKNGVSVCCGQPEMCSESTRHLHFIFGDEVGYPIFRFRSFKPICKASDSGFVFLIWS